MNLHLNFKCIERRLQIRKKEGHPFGLLSSEI